MKTKVALAVIVITILVIGAFVMNILHHKPFRFEDFKTVQEAQFFFNGKYHKGSSVQMLIDDAEGSGAKCRLATQYELSKHEELKNFIFCDYRYGVLIDIEWTISINRNGDSIIAVTVSRTSTSM